MILQQLVARMRGARRLEELARHIAVECHEEVWRNVSRRAGSMGIAETRGYIRARCASLVQRHVDDMLAESGSSHATRDRLTSLTMQSVVRQTVERIMEEASSNSFSIRRAA